MCRASRPAKVTYLHGELEMARARETEREFAEIDAEEAAGEAAFEGCMELIDGMRGQLSP